MSEVSERIKVNSLTRFAHYLDVLLVLARRPCTHQIRDKGVDTRVLLLHIAFSKAAPQKRGSMKPMEPPLDPPLMLQLAIKSTYQLSQQYKKQDRNNLIV